MWYSNYYNNTKMLEVMNGFLLVYFVILCTFSALSSVLVKPVIACFARPSNFERTTFDNIQKLKAEQKCISMKDEFAAYSKIQRKINKLETELKESSQTRMSRSLAVKSTIQIIFQVTLYFIIIVSVIYFRREPIVAFKANLFPFSSMLRYPSEMPNAISTHVWVVISNFSIRTLMKPVLS